MAIFIFLSASAQKKEVVKVWGNCGMCEKTIETAAKSAGASEADWNQQTKLLTVSHNIDLAKIEKAIAAAGYDTEHFTAPDAAYAGLPGCCQYDRKAASSDGKQVAAAGCCKDGKCQKGENCKKDADGKASCVGCEKCKAGSCGEHGKGACCAKPGQR